MILLRYSLAADSFFDPEGFPPPTNPSAYMGTSAWSGDTPAMAVPTGRAMASPPGPTTAVAMGLLAATPPTPVTYQVFCLLS